MMEILYRLFIVCCLTIIVCIPVGLSLLFLMSNEDIDE